MRPSLFLSLYEFYHVVLRSDKTVKSTVYYSNHVVFVDYRNYHPQTTAVKTICSQSAEKITEGELIDHMLTTSVESGTL